LLNFSLRTASRLVTHTPAPQIQPLTIGAPKCLIVDNDSVGFLQDSWKSGVDDVCDWSVINR